MNGRNPRSLSLFYLIIGIVRSNLVVYFYLSLKIPEKNFREEQNHIIFNQEFYFIWTRSTST